MGKDANGKDARTGGLVSRETQETIKKYIPDLTTYGIGATAIGAFTPLGALGGLLIGSATAYAKILKISKDLYLVILMVI